MKIKLLLITIIIGFVFIDLACRNDESGCNNKRFEVIGIKEITLNEIIPNGASKFLIRDSIPYDSILFIVNFNEKSISRFNNFNFIPTSYATPPCLPPSTNWFLDSVKILKLDNNLTTDLTNWFSLSGLNINNYDNAFVSHLNNFSTHSPVQMKFKIHKQPLQKDTFQFKFQFYDTKHKLFEVSTIPVIITP
jgi:hypothetical protein